MRHGIPKPITYRGVRHLGVSVSTVWRRYHRQERIDSPVVKVQKPCMLDGRKYPTLAICADFLGVPLTVKGVSWRQELWKLI